MTNAYDPVRYDGQLGGLKKVLRKIAGPVLAVGAVAAGQPQLAVAAYNVGHSATAKKQKQPILAEPVPEVPPGLFSSLTTADRNALLLGGGVLAAVLLIGRRRK